MPTGNNSDIYRNGPHGLIDAAPVITLRAAGALIFGKTTTTFVFSIPFFLFRTVEAARHDEYPKHAPELLNNV
jgi:hypothetical protein